MTTVSLSGFLIVAGGCASSQWAKLRRSPLNPLVHQLELDSRSGPQPTSQTLQILRRNDLAKDLQSSPGELVNKVQEIAHREPSADNVYAISEVAYIDARRFEEQGDIERALDLYATAAANAYFYLFDKSFARGRNQYDPKFRRACDLYNNSLESALRHFQNRNLLQCGGSYMIETGSQSFEFEVATRGTWHENNFRELKFASDFEVASLKNVYRQYGLGVPLIAVYQPEVANATTKFYPPGMSFPVTAFMRIVQSTRSAVDGEPIRHRCVIELHDAMVDAEITVEDQWVPLETDLTTPLAYSLENPVFKEANVAINGLRRADQSLAASGIYLLEPFDSRKIPVVMVHGFWSSLVTWMEMFNDLRGSPEIRERFQFWFYLYPTGVPPWHTAALLREQLAEIRKTFDPSHELAMMDQTVLVGHSMGGLLCTMQTLSSEDLLWQQVSTRPIDELNASTEDLGNLKQAFFFEPNRAVSRVVTIATPFEGSNFSNMATQWMGRRWINLPESLVATRTKLLADNPGYFREHGLADVTTSVSALAVDSPLLNFLKTTPKASWVKYHNIMGQIDNRAVWKAVAQDSDGIVRLASAHSDDAISEIVVPSDHVSVHRHPRAILEVRRILREHLSEILANPTSPPPDWGRLTQRP